MIGGRYQILATLGQGGMGLVYRAYDPVLDRTIALKKMVASVVDGDERRARFYIEARAAARLNHPNIVTIYELEEHGGDVYIVMELLEGVSLAAFLQKRVPLSLAGHLTILAQVAEGLHYAHERAVVHRDIKPANVVLTTTGTVKILDFGIAQLAAQAITKAGAMLGTPHYMSPEQIKDEPVDARADLFSLGAVAYELVSGTRPFDAESIAAVLLRITTASHTPLKEAAPGTAPALADIIESLLAKDRTQRPATGAAVCQSLERLGDIDRVDLVAEAVRTIVGPVADRSVFAPITPTPRPASPTPTPAGMPPIAASPHAPTTALRTPPPPPSTPPAGAALEQETALLGAPVSLPVVPPPVMTTPEPPASPPPPPLPPPSNAAPKPVMFVDSGVPQARTRHGSGMTLIAIVGVLLVAMAGAGWWGYVSIRELIAKRASSGAPASPSTSRSASTTPTATPPAEPRPADAPPAEARADAVVPSPPPAPPDSSTSPSSPPSSEAVPPPLPAAPLTSTPVRVDGSTTPSIAPTAPPPPAPPVTPRVVGNASNGERARTTEPRRPASELSRPSAPPEAPRDSPREVARDAPRDAPRDGPRDANRDEPAREPGAPRDTERPSSPATDQRQPLDAGSLAAFQRGSRSRGDSGAFYSDAPTTAAAIARVTYAVEAYSDAIAKRDLEALREVRSPVTPAEASWLKDGTTTVRFSNLDVSVAGTDAVVRCRRTIVSDGKTRSSGAVVLHLTRKPAGWVITDIR